MTHSVSSTTTETIKNFKISKKKMNWFDAENFCKAWGMRLPVDKDFGCTYSYLKNCSSPVIAELKKILDSN